MPAELIALLQNSGAPVIIVGVFVWYLLGKQKMDQETYNQFNSTIQQHLEAGQELQKESNSVIRENTRQQERLSATVDNFERTMKRAIAKQSKGGK